MQQALLVTVWFHEGRYHGTGDWPPAPARLFQAIMAGSADGTNIPSDIGDALKWLEALPPPVIAVPRGVPGQDFTNYVPNNDLDSELAKGKAPDISKAIAAIRDGKHFQSILFDAEMPILYCWSFGDGGGQAEALRGAANKLYQLGRGIDAAWAEAVVLTAADAEEMLESHGGIVHRPSGGIGRRLNLLCPRPGTQDSLVKRFNGMRIKFRQIGTNRKKLTVFVQPPKPLLAKVAYDIPPRRLLFHLRRTGTGDEFAVRPLQEAAPLIQFVRDNAAQRLREAAPDIAAKVDRYLVGRGATDSDKDARVCIVPIPSVGHPHADMDIRRLAIYVPQTCPLPVEDIAWAFSQVCWVDEDGVVTSELQQVEEDRMTDRFEKHRQLWHSITPVALATSPRRRIRPGTSADDDGAKGGSERAAEQARAALAVHQGLRHAGVNTPVSAVRVRREPFDLHGQRVEPFARNTRFAKEALWHVAVDFTAPVRGPFLLGDGRFLGLGLMVPGEPVRGVTVFSIVGGIEKDADHAAVAQAAHRAMTARVQANLQKGTDLPEYVGGHGIRHVSILADLPRRRILYMAPNRLQRHGIEWRHVAYDHGRMARAFEGMRALRAGSAGDLALAPAHIDEENDPLFAPSNIWESVTAYDAVRHPHGAGDEEALKADAIAELRRCNWPTPNAVEVLAIRCGSREGFSGRLRFVFATAQQGPLAIGRTAHKGGGLFVGATTTGKHEV